MCCVKFKETNKFAQIKKLANQSTLNKAHVITITKACVSAFMKQEIPLLFDVERTKKQKIVKMYFLRLLLKFFFNNKKLFMANLLSNGLDEKVTICYIIMIYN